MINEPENIEIRRANISDLERIQTFIVETYGATSPYKNPDRWLWQFVNNPFHPCDDKEPTVWIALCEGRVVGQIAVQDGAVCLRGARISAGWIVDVMVHPSFRGLGLGHRIHAEIMKERSVLVTLTMAAATRKIAERAGCLTLCDTSQMILPGRISASTVSRFLVYKSTFRPKLIGPIQLFNASRIGPSLIASSISIVAWLRSRRVPSPKKKGFEFVEVDRFPSGVNALWNTVRNSFPAIFERTTQFLNWRFCDCPGLAYRRFLLCEGENNVRGYVVTRVAEPVELPQGVIADVFASPENPELFDMLIEKALQVLTPNCEYVEASASTDTCRAALHRAGFLSTRVHRPTIVCTDSDLASQLETATSDWYFTKADHDWDQVHPI